MRRGQTRVSSLQDPSWLLVRQWKLSGPTGQSKQRADGYLGLDWASLEHRYEDQLMSLGAVSTLNVASSDPIGASLTAALGGMPLGGRALGGGSSGSGPQSISHIREAGDRLFLARGGYVTQVNPASWVVEQTKTLTAVVRGMAVWFNKLRLGMGAQLALQTVTGINASGATYTATQVSGSDVLAKELMEGNNRLWQVQADAAATNENRLRYTLDDFASNSNNFVVGDPGVPATAIGRMGPYTVVGGERGVLSFTDDAFPQHLIEALRDTVSPDNGRKQAYQFGWNYTITALGLYAMRPGLSNPVGIGSKSMWGFDGFDGKPVAVRAWRESLIVVWENSAGDTWRVMEGTFNPAFTDATGELDWFMLASRTNAAVKDVGATGVPTLPTIVWGEGTGTLARIAKGRGGRDISDASYTFSVAGGQAFFSTLLEMAHLRKTVRYGKFFTKNMASGNTWTLAIAYDDGSYTNIGSAVTAAGSAKVVPATPTSAPSGFLPKPRLTQVAGAGTASTTPPTLIGVLEIAFDMRPDRVDDLQVMLAPLTLVQLEALRRLTDPANTEGQAPIEARDPDRPQTLRYAYVRDMEEFDVAGDHVYGAELRVTFWETS